MTPKILPITVSALHEILKWSAGRPIWQQDALRRIVTQDTLQEKDLNELDRLCRGKHNADTSTEPPITPQPLAASHLPPAPGAESAVTLVSIGNLQRVNRLPSDQVLAFGAAPGLTVVYGDNGSGKSGYARVIKKACRTRGAPPTIKPNAFAPSTTAPAMAEIVCRVAGNDHPVSWTDGVASHARLANVFVFDASTAGHYLLEDGPATFTPRGLGVLPKLSDACDAVKARIQKNIESLKADIEATAKNWRYSPTTRVGALIVNLSASTQNADIEAMAVHNEAQANRLKELNDALKSDPKQKAMATSASAARLRTFASKAAILTRELSEDRCLVLRKLIEEAESTAKTAKSFATGQFDSTYLPGTGSDLWRALFEAARSYAVVEGYKDKEFPATNDGARCVLCQQNLDEQAAARLRAFDAFCKDQSQLLATQAVNRLSEAAQKITPLDALSLESAKIEADLAIATAEQRAALVEFAKVTDARLQTLRTSLTKRTWTDSLALPMSPESDIVALATALDERAVMEKSADDPAALAKLISERDELAAREWLSGVKDDVLAQIDRHKQIAVLEICQKDTTTRGITDKNSELTKQIVTDAFCKRFETEVKNLGLRTLAVKMEHIQGKKGETRFGLRLEGATDHKVHEIASEGEQRCIALAAFLAELSQASHQSSLVFDDPVSSLDHWHREKLAARLVVESRVRQVIVLTHDTVFLNDLQTHAQDHAIAATFRYVEWIASNPGRCHDGLPWDCKSPEDRLDNLEKQQREILSRWVPQPTQENEVGMRIAYSWLRATLERIVERVVFADVVFRFRSYVKLKDLKEVVGFSHAECDELLRLYKRCCDVTDAHDPASGKHAPVPLPAELAKDITDTKTLLMAIRQRRKAKNVSAPLVVAAAIP